MSDLMKSIIRDIEESKTINQICGDLNISRKRLYYLLSLLKNNGYFFKNVYCSNGEIKPSLVKTVDLYNDFNNLNISFDREDSNLKTLVISDLHFGNELERLDVVDMMYNYCINNNIHVILCCGDILDGTFSKGCKNISNGMEQLEYFIKYYPYDKSISTLAVLGDHDFSILKDYSYDPAVLIGRHRFDIGIGGYNYTFVNVRKDKIQLHHHFSEEPNVDASRIVLHGHFHKYNAKINCQNSQHMNSLHVNVPALCDILTGTPSALEMTISFKKKSINKANVKQLVVINNSVIEINEIDYLLKGINIQEDVSETMDVKKRELQLK